MRRSPSCKYNQNHYSSGKSRADYNRCTGSPRILALLCVILLTAVHFTNNGLLLRVLVAELFHVDNPDIAPWFFKVNIWDLAIWGWIYYAGQRIWDRIVRVAKATAKNLTHLIWNTLEVLAIGWAQSAWVRIRDMVHRPHAHSARNTSIV